MNKVQIELKDKNGNIVPVEVDMEEYKPEYHPIASSEPLMLSSVITIAQDMLLHGYSKSTPLTMFEGKILDGRSRTIAANAVGVRTKTITFKGTAEEAQAESDRLNGFRRHRTPSQNAAKAAYEIYYREQERKAYKQELLEENPEWTNKTITVKIGKKFPKITAEEMARKHQVNQKYITYCLTFLKEKRFDMGDMVNLIFEGKMDLSTARHRYKELKEKYMLTGKEARVYTDEELLVFEKEDLAKNHPRNAALEIVAGIKTANELRELIHKYEKYIDSVEGDLAELSVLRDTIDSIGVKVGILE